MCKSHDMQAHIHLVVVESIYIYLMVDQIGAKDDGMFFINEVCDHIQLNYAIMVS